MKNIDYYGLVIIFEHFPIVADYSSAWFCLGIRYQNQENTQLFLGRSGSDRTCTHRMPDHTRVWPGIIYSIDKYNTHNSFVHVISCMRLGGGS